jgi:hypothetical protein
MFYNSIGFKCCGWLPIIKSLEHLMKLAVGMQTRAARHSQIEGSKDIQYME